MWYSVQWMSPRYELIFVSWCFVLELFFVTKMLSTAIYISVTQTLLHMYTHTHTTASSNLGCVVPAKGQSPGAWGRPGASKQTIQPWPESADPHDAPSSIPSAPHHQGDGGATPGAGLSQTVQLTALQEVKVLRWRLWRYIQHNWWQTVN